MGDALFWYLVGSIATGIGVSCVWLYIYDIVKQERDRAKSELRSMYESIYKQQSEENQKWLAKRSSR